MLDPLGAAPLGIEPGQKDQKMKSSLKTTSAETLAQRQIKTPMGPLFVVASDRGIRGFYWKKQNIKNGSPVQKSIDSVLSLCEKQLQEYFSGKRKTFDMPLDLIGTEFQKTVWRELLKIPHGTTISYGALAARIRNPKASRAVGSANGKNPICIVVPCHRVIAANGSIGGYSGGLAKKRTLLKLEGLIFKAGRP